MQIKVLQHLGHIECDDQRLRAIPQQFSRIVAYGSNHRGSHEVRFPRSWSAGEEPLWTTDVGGDRGKYSDQEVGEVTS
jgi:hypothetical protein